MMWQDLADATGREVWVDPHVSDHSAFGAAMFAASSLGRSIPHRGNAITVAPRGDMYGWWTDALASHDALRLTLGDR